MKNEEVLKIFDLAFFIWIPAVAGQALQFEIWNFYYERITSHILSYFSFCAGNGCFGGYKPQDLPFRHLAFI